VPPYSLQKQPYLPVLTLYFHEIPSLMTKTMLHIGGIYERLKSRRGKGNSFRDKSEKSASKKI
jgi:hypothetical protein